MNTASPGIVAVYDLGSWAPRRVAEFRLDSQGHAELHILADEGCPLAAQWHRDGVEILGRRHHVPASDGPEFLRALLQPFGLSYYEFVDETPTTPTPWS